MNQLSSDDEYRLLRQDLFDRLAGGSAIPQEAPIVPVNNPVDPSRAYHISRFIFVIFNLNIPNSLTTCPLPSNFFLRHTIHSCIIHYL